MTKEEFKKRWEKDETGDGITNEEVAKCYIEWGLGSSPYTKPINYVIWRVCESANTNDKDFWHEEYIKGKEGD